MVRSSEPSWWDHCFHLSASFPSGSHSPPMDVKEVGSLGKELRANWLPGLTRLGFVLRETYLLYWFTPFSLQPPPG